MPDIDCQFTEWTQWSSCSKSCDGLKARSRRIQVQGQGHGEWCRGATQERTACPACGDAPPVDCVLGQWSAWSSCQATCGSAQVRRERLLKREARRGGQACQGSLVDIKDCDLPSCPSPPPVDCLYGEWGSWGACTQEGGQRNRFRHILRQARHGGKACEAGAVEEMDGCPRPQYVSFCIWAEWEEWSPCARMSKQEVILGRRSRVRHLVLAATSDRSAMSELYEAPGGDRSWGMPLFSQTLRLEVLLAFMCGYAGRAALSMSCRRPSGRNHASTLSDWFGARHVVASRSDYLPVAADEGSALVDDA